MDSKLPNYRTALEVASKDRDNLTLDVAMALSAAKVKVTALTSPLHAGRTRHPSHRGGGAGQGGAGLGHQ